MAPPVRDGATPLITPTPIAARPEDAGIDSEKLEAVFARVRRDVDDGTVPSAQVAIARHGRLAAFVTFGSAVQGGAEAPATNDTLYVIYSATKAIVAAAVWALIEEQQLRVEERVAAIVPEFGTNGKNAITVEQVLLHLGGFPMQSMGPRDWGTKEGRRAAFARWQLDFPPGTQWMYHAMSAHWVLAEIIEERTGLDFRRYVHQRVIDPMGLSGLYLGLPAELNARVATVQYMGPPAPPPGGYGAVTPEVLLALNHPVARAAGIPGGGAIGRAADLALFYQVLINGGRTLDGKQILKPETIAYATRVRTTAAHVDPALGHPVNRGLSIVVAGGDGLAFQRGMGRTVSPRAFGHNGAGGQIAWGDPQSGISLGYCSNGFLDPEAQARKNTAIGSLAAVCAAGN